VTRSFFEKVMNPRASPEMLAPMFQCEDMDVPRPRVNPVAAAEGAAIGHGTFACSGRARTRFRGQGLNSTQKPACGRGDAGCQLAVVVTNGGSASERNCLRLGFKVAYSKATVLKKLQEQG
jgi:hypothetical protein